MFNVTEVRKTLMAIGNGYTGDRLAAMLAPFPEGSKTFVGQALDADLRSPDRIEAFRYLMETDLPSAIVCAMLLQENAFQIVEIIERATACVIAMDEHT